MRKARAIDASALIEKIREEGILGNGWDDEEREDDVCRMIDDMPTIYPELKPNRVLTFEEIMNLDPDGTIWIEDKKSGEMEMVPNSEILGDLALYRVAYGNKEMERCFNMYARCWIAPPD